MGFDMVAKEDGTRRSLGICGRGIYTAQGEQGQPIKAAEACTKEEQIRCGRKQGGNEGGEWCYMRKMKPFCWCLRWTVEEGSIRRMSAIDNGTL